MDGTMRERIARALAVADGKDPDAPAWAVTRGGRTYPEGICWRDQYASKADAVLDAMREPDEAMIDAGIHGPQRGMNMGEAAAATFTAMIDAARTPAKES